MTKKKNHNLMTSKKIQKAIATRSLVKAVKLADQIHDGFSKQAEILFGNTPIGTVGYSDTLKGRNRWMSLDPESGQRFPNRASAIDLCISLSVGKGSLWGDKADSVDTTCECRQEDGKATREYAINLQRDGDVFIDCHLSIDGQEESHDLFSSGANFTWHRVTEQPVRTKLASLLIPMSDWSVICQALNKAWKAQISDAVQTGTVIADEEQEEGEEGEGLLDIYGDSPYDPARAEFVRKSHTVSLLMTRIKEGELLLEPDFQRQAGLWSSKTSSRLIESLLLGIPLPLFIFREMKDGGWQCVDGLQRLTTLVNFINGGSKLKSLEYLPLKGATFNDLHRKYQRKVLESELSCVIIGESVPISVTFNVFSRLNAGGVKLNPQELRHALNQGKAATTLKALACSPEFLQATGKGIASKRMQDREAVLRFFAFTINDPATYKGGMSQFLAKTMEQMNAMSESTLSIKCDLFRNAMVIADNFLGNDAFRLHATANPERRSRVNKALFECWSVAFGALKQSQVDMIIDGENRADFKAGLLSLIESDTLYNDACTAATSRTSAVQARHATARSYIKGKILEYASKVGPRRTPAPKSTVKATATVKAPAKPSKAPAKKKATTATSKPSKAPVEPTETPSNGMQVTNANGKTEFKLSEVNKEAVRAITRKAVKSGGVSVVLPTGTRVGIKTRKARGSIAFVTVDLLTGEESVCGKVPQLLAQLQSMA